MRVAVGHQLDDSLRLEIAWKPYSDRSGPASRRQIVKRSKPWTPFLPIQRWSSQAERRLLCLSPFDCIRPTSHTFAPERLLSLRTLSIAPQPTGSVLLTPTTALLVITTLCDSKSDTHIPTSRSLPRPEGSRPSRPARASTTSSLHRAISDIELRSIHL